MTQISKKTSLLLVVLLGVAAMVATPSARADDAADKKLLKQLEPFVATLEEKDVATVKTLVEAPNFRPTMEYYKNYSIFEETLHLYNIKFARLIMASPSWKKVQWNAKNTAKPLLLAASDAELLPILQDLAKQPNFDLNTPQAEDGEFPVLRAAKRDNLPALKWLASQPKVDVNKRDALDRNALFDASHQATLFLIALPQFDANSRSMAGDTALHNAVEAGEMDTVRALLAIPKIDPNIRDKSENPSTPLDLALHANNVEIAKILMANRKVRETPTQRALLKRLGGVAASPACQASFNVSVSDKKLLNQLMWAISANDMVRSQKFINAPNFSPLLVAKVGDNTVFEAALSFGRATIARQLLLAD